MTAAELNELLALLARLPSEERAIARGILAKEAAQAASACLDGGDVEDDRPQQGTPRRMMDDLLI